MKMCFGLTLMFFASLSGASELVSTCDVGAKTRTRVEIVRDSEIGDTHIYYVRQAGGIKAFFGNPDDSRGSDVHIACAGKKRHALVVSGVFTSNFLQGFVLDQSPATGKIERLDFAEKSRPERLYLGAKKTLIVVPTNGYGETNKKYIMYRHVAGSTTDLEPVGIDKPPAVGRFEVIQLEQSTASK